MGVDILAGTNFLIENDVYPRAPDKNHWESIVIHGTVTVPATPPSVLSLDKMDKNRSKERFLSVTRNICILPGEEISFQIPNEILEVEEFAVEPNLAQTKAFFAPKIITSTEGALKLSNSRMNLIKSSRSRGIRNLSKFAKFQRSIHPLRIVCLVLTIQSPYHRNLSLPKKYLNVFKCLYNHRGSVEHRSDIWSFWVSAFRPCHT